MWHVEGEATLEQFILMLIVWWGEVRAGRWGFQKLSKPEVFNATETLANLNRIHLTMTEHP